MMTTVSLQIVGIIEPIIQHADWFFPGGEERWQSRNLTTFPSAGGPKPSCPSSFVSPRNRVQRHGELREPRPHQPQRQLQLHAVARHGSDGAQAERPEPPAPQRRHGQHDAGVLQEGRVRRSSLLRLLFTTALGEDV